VPVACGLLRHDTHYLSKGMSDRRKILAVCFLGCDEGLRNLGSYRANLGVVSGYDDDMGFFLKILISSMFVEAIFAIFG
jgi:hypothetical protein